MVDEEQAQQPPGPPAKRRPSSMGSILKKTTGRTPPGRAEVAVEEETPARQLAEVPWEELAQAVTEMCARLNVDGAVSGLYDLYAAVAGEWGKAHRAEG